MEIIMVSIGIFLVGCSIGIFIAIGVDWAIRKMESLGSQITIREIAKQDVCPVCHMTHGTHTAICLKDTEDGLVRVKNIDNIS